ncbi:MAG: hypothetical protein CK426_01485 [Legionella sp.]|nr:MAG: hypothetical protein CK423_04585 [Legionella sp.]PJD99747.1 MAG: hypothetical protein CK426_01485 [Legionella sp.]
MDIFSKMNLFLYLATKPMYFSLFMAKEAQGKSISLNQKGNLKLVLIFSENRNGANRFFKGSVKISG